MDILITELKANDYFSFRGMETVYQVDASCVNAFIYCDHSGSKARTQFPLANEEPTAHVIRHDPAEVTQAHSACKK